MEDDSTSVLGNDWVRDLCKHFQLSVNCNEAEQKHEETERHPINPSENQALRPTEVTDAPVGTKDEHEIKGNKLREILDLLVHVSQCWSKQCLHQNCHKLKELFHHGIRCKTRADGGCDLCRLMWYFLQLHARVCKEIICHVPRCRDIKELLRARGKELS